VRVFTVTGLPTIGVATLGVHVQLDVIYKHEA